jgi:sortase A
LLTVDRGDRRPAARTERALWAAGFACLAYCLFVWAQGSFAHHVSAHVEDGAKHVSLGAGDAPSPRADADGVMGRLEIPSLRMSVAVLSDYDPASLRRGVGHIKGTAMPGGLGTLGLAGHRDTYFRPLARIAPGMEIRVADSTGMYRYIVDSTEIVTPDRVEVLSIRSRPELTLVTCYPFHYIGAAPKRFIVHAHLVSAAPDAG